VCARGFAVDEQPINLQFQLPEGFNLSNCGANSLWLDGVPPSTSILPATSAWRLASRIRSHPGDADDLRECVVEIAAQRRWERFMLRRLLPDVLVVLGGLVALWLDPKAPPLVGGRCGLLVTATLLVSNKLSAGTEIDRGLHSVGWMDVVKAQRSKTSPRVTYIARACDVGCTLKALIQTTNMCALTWLLPTSCQFALMQIAFLVLGLFETVFVHGVIRLGSTAMVDRALSFDGIHMRTGFLVLRVHVSTSRDQGTYMHM
jgi:hypothetical protein